MRNINKTGFALRRTLHLGVLAITALLVASTAQAELNWKSSGTPSVSCEVTRTDSRFLFFGEWTDIALTYYVTEEPAIKINYKCEATIESDGDGGAHANPKKHTCYSKPHGSSTHYTLQGADMAILNISPGVNRMDVCYRLYESAGIKVTKK